MASKSCVRAPKFPRELDTQTSLKAGLFRFAWTSLVCLSACSTKPPQHWAEGGSTLALGPASWTRDNGRIDLNADGRVVDDGKLLFSIDRVGRVVDEDNEPVAMLYPTGELGGPDQQYLGRIGLRNGAPPHDTQAWFALVPDQTVLRFDEDGDRHPDGRWTGCEGARLRTCTLVTQLILLRSYRAPRRGPVVGVGVGLWF